MTKSNWILTYYQKVKNGSVVVGHWIELILEYIVNGLQEKAFFYDQKKANEAIDWIEAHAFHTEGPLAPQPLKLELWEKAFVASIYGIVDEKGFRQFREVVLIVARKNGKSLLASAIAKYEWWCGGYGTKVYNIAPKLAQADIIYNNIWQMITLDPDNNSLMPGDPNKARHRMTDYFLEATNSTVKKIAFSQKKSSGFNSSLVIADEVADWEGDKGLKQYEVLKSGMGARREPLLISASTSGYTNDSIFDELMKRSTSFLLGNSKEKRLLPFIYMVDDPEKYGDIKELKKANPNLGVSVSEEYMLDELAIAESSASKKAEFLCKYCNIKQNSSQAWLESKYIEKATEKDIRLEDFAETYAVAGIDLSRTKDLTACSVVIERDGELNIFTQFFMPRGRIEIAQQEESVPYEAYVNRGFLTLSGDNFVDYRDCYNWMTDLIEKYKIYVLQTGYDRYNASYLTQDLENYGFRMDDVYQGDNLHPVIEEFSGLLADGKINIGKNDLLKAHFYNSAIKMSHERGRGRLVKLYPRAHIDGMASVLDAMTVRMKWYNEIGEQLKNED